MSITEIIIGKKTDSKLNVGGSEVLGIKFLKFIWNKKENRLLLWITVFSSIIEFLIFKILYPFPDFFSDSYSYIYAAYAHLDVSIWPIGYSKFLEIFHIISRSDTTLVSFQYSIYILSALYLFYTVLYFYTPKRISKIILYIFLFSNPLFWYLCNYINSDPIFLALSLVWFTQLIWIIHRPARYQLFVNAILLFLCFTVRNNAYYYPLISIIAFLISKQAPIIKIIGALIPFCLIIPFVIHTKKIAKQITGSSQYSLFTGWQLANNALYMYDRISVDENIFNDKEKVLDHLSKEFFKTVPSDFHQVLFSYVGNFYIRESESPLKQYFFKNYIRNNEYENMMAWGKASILFEAYGLKLIKSHPISFFKYFLIPNTKNYFLPPLEKLEIYNTGLNHVYAIAQDWFNYTTPDITSISKRVQGKILFLFPHLFMFLNLYIIGFIVWILSQKKYGKLTEKFKGSFILFACLILANFIFCVFATIVVLRYEIFPMILCLILSLLLTESLEIKNIKNQPTIL